LAQPTAGKPTQPPAGRASTQSASVAGVAEDGLCPDLDAASVAAFAAIDKELCLAKDEEYVLPPPPKTPVIIQLRCGNKDLHALVNTGSELNLISETAAKRVGLTMRSLPRATCIHLAMDNKAIEPLILWSYTVASLQDPHSTLEFPRGGPEGQPHRGELRSHPWDSLSLPFQSISIYSATISAMQ
jgi:hypothetical protein